jgi:hypothetical protein
MVLDNCARGIIVLHHNQAMPIKFKAHGWIVLPKSLKVKIDAGRKMSNAITSAYYFISEK